MQEMQVERFESKSKRKQGNIEGKGLDFNDIFLYQSFNLSFRLELLADA